MASQDASEWIVSAKVGELLASDRFDKDSISQRELRLSQAFCLLWQNQSTGDVAGRQRPNALTATATAAVLLDLYVLNKIDFDKDVKHWMDKTRQVIMVKVGTIGKVFYQCNSLNMAVNIEVFNKARSERKK